MNAQLPARPVQYPDGAVANGLEALLTYLDAALAAETAAPVRLLALLCLLRADRDGAVRLPRGLLCGWRLADRAPQSLDELVRQRWLGEHSGTAVAAPQVQIRDNAGIAVLRSSDRRHRGRLLNQANQLLHQPEVRGAPVPDRLAALRAQLAESQPLAPSSHPCSAAEDCT